LFSKICAGETVITAKSCYTDLDLVVRNGEAATFFWPLG
jgi:hypothetical protein